MSFLCRGFYCNTALFLDLIRIRMDICLPLLLCCSFQTDMHKASLLLNQGSQTYNHVDHRSWYNGIFCLVRLWPKIQNRSRRRNCFLTKERLCVSCFYWGSDRKSTHQPLLFFLVAYGCVVQLTATQSALSRLWRCVSFSMYCLLLLLLWIIFVTFSRY